MRNLLGGTPRHLPPFVEGGGADPPFDRFADPRIHRTVDHSLGLANPLGAAGTQAAFVSAGGYHHHIGLNTWESLGGSPPPAGTTGLYHVAILYPTRTALADALRRLIGSGVPLDGASDHGVSEALYLHDPDGNGVELYWDRPPGAWPRTPKGELAMFTRRLDLDDLLGELGTAQVAPEVNEGPQDL